jgi:hypothetical protein
LGGLDALHPPGYGDGYRFGPGKAQADIDQMAAVVIQSERQIFGVIPFLIQQ